MTYEGNKAYRFDRFTLDVDRGALLDDASAIRLRPKSFEVLRYLVEHGGKLVSRDELLESVWAGTVVTDDAVTQCLIDIRKALGDTSQRMIRTVHGRGYVFETPVTAVADSAPGESAGRALTRPVRAVVLGALAIAMAAFLWWSLASPPDEPTAPDADAGFAPEQAIAVLPFADLSPSQDQAYFADGVSEEILNMLARRGVVRVIARTSSFSFRDSKADISSIAAQLNVTHLLEGSIRKDGDTVRISVQLVDAASGEYVWTERFDRELSASSLFDIQTEIAAAVTRSLPVEAPEESRSRGGMPTDSLIALESYFEGKRLLETRDPSQMKHASELFAKATRIDPRFALAYVALADTYRLLHNYGTLPKPVSDELARQAVDRALDLDGELAAAYASLANIKSASGDRSGAEAAYLRCIELNPNYAPAYQWYGEFLAFNGRATEGARYSRVAVSLDPRSAIIASDYAEALSAAGRHSEALSQYDAALEIDPEFAVAYTGKALTLHVGMGRIAEAIPLFDRAHELTPTSPRVPVYLARAYLDLGDLARAASLVEQAALIAPGTITPALGMLEVQVYTGDADAAIRSSGEILEMWPDWPMALRYLRDEYLSEARFDEALALYRSLFADLLDDPRTPIEESSLDAAVSIAHIRRRAGEAQEADRLLEGVENYLARRDGGFSFTDPQLVAARLHAIRGDADAAMATLQNVVDGGWRYRWWYELRHDSTFDILAGHPGFQALLQEIQRDMAQQQRALEGRVNLRAATGAPSPAAGRARLARARPPGR